MLKSILLASALSLSTITLCQAAALPADDMLITSKGEFSNLILLAKSSNSGSGNSGSGNSGGGNSGGGNSGGNDDSGNDGGGDDGTPDQGGGNDDDSADEDSNDDVSGSGRKKPRIPGGSGCDDAGDIAEHPECTPQ